MTSLTAEQAGVPNEAAAYLKSLEDPEIVERVRCNITDAHVFKLPPRQTAGGWRGADWKQEVWQGALQVVERGNLTVILLKDVKTGSIFAVCPVKEGAVDRCIDSSRYFVLRVENADRHVYIGLAFNERNDAFEFNVSLEDSRREKQQEEEVKAAPPLDSGRAKDYSMKDGEKIHISVSKVAGRRSSNNGRRASGGGASGGFLKPSSKDTPRRGSGLGTFAPGTGTVDGSNAFH